MTKENAETFSRMGKVMIDKLQSSRRELMDAAWMADLSGLTNTVIEMNKTIKDIEQYTHTVAAEFEKAKNGSDEDSETIPSV